MAIAQPVGIGPQDAREDRVERAGPQPRGRGHTHHQSDALFHLVGRLVGKGERQQTIGGIPHLQEVSYFVGKHPSLSRPGTGNHQFGPLGIEYGFALLLVEFVQKIFFHLSLVINANAKIQIWERIAIITERSSQSLCQVIKMCMAVDRNIVFCFEIE